MTVFEIQNTGETDKDQEQFVWAVWPCTSRLGKVARKQFLAENKNK